MPYYNKCEVCGANLDPGERCDCDRPQFLTVSALARRWSVSADLVYDILKSGTLRALKLGGTTWRIPLAAVEEYEQKSMTGRSSGGQQKRPTANAKKPVLRI